MFQDTIKQPSAWAVIGGLLSTPVGMTVAALGILGLGVMAIHKLSQDDEDEPDGSDNRSTVELTASEPFDEPSEITVQTVDPPPTKMDEKEQIRKVMSMLGKKSGEARRKR